MSIFVNFCNIFYLLLTINNVQINKYINSYISRPYLRLGICHITLQQSKIINLKKVTSTTIPVDTRRRFNVDNTSIQRRKCHIDVS